MAGPTGYKGYQYKNSDDTIFIANATAGNMAVALNQLSSALTGYVPYTGATTDVLLGSHYLRSQNLFTDQLANIGTGAYILDGSPLNPLIVKATQDSYTAVTMHNISPGLFASSDLIASNDIDDGTILTGHYIDMGINSSAHSDPTYPVLDGANNGYFYINRGDLTIGTGDTVGGKIRFFVNTFANSAIIANISQSGLAIGIGATAAGFKADIQDTVNATNTLLQLKSTVAGTGQIHSGLQFVGGVSGTTTWKFGIVNNSTQLALQGNAITYYQFASGGLTLGTFASSGGGNNGINLTANHANSSGISAGIKITMIGGNNTTGGLTGIQVNANGTYSGSGVQFLADLLAANITQWNVDITGNSAQRGNHKLTIAGAGHYVKEGLNATMGIATLVAGQVIVPTTKVTAVSRIFLTAKGQGLNIGFVYENKGLRVPGTSFTINSLNVLDTQDVDWIIIEPA